MEPSKSGSLFKRLLDLPWTLTEPAPTITEGGMRRKARFLRTALLTGVAVFPILQFANNSIQEFPVYSLLTLILAGVYLLSATEHLQIASTITIIIAAILPYVTILLKPTWSAGVLSQQMLSWPILAALLGSQLLSLKREALLIGAMNIGLLILSLSHPGIVFGDAIELIGVGFAIQMFLMFTSWTQEYYSTQLEHSNRTHAARGKELEIYTSLLRHDLGNDVQMILGGIELSQMSNGEPRQDGFLDSILAAAQRMKSLLQIFSMSEAELDSDIVTVIEQIGKRAEIAFKGMRVSINVSEEVKQSPPKYGRLVALAFENLLRNASQHAGNDPNVELMISQSGDNLEILFGDDGPGIDSSIRDNLFEKGVSTEAESHGLGLYLTRTIIESENGSIELTTQNGPGCCFLIKLPY